MNEYAKALVNYLEANCGWSVSLHEQNADDLAAALSAVPKPVKSGSREISVRVKLHDSGTRLDDRGCQVTPIESKLLAIAAESANLDQAAAVNAVSVDAWNTPVARFGDWRSRVPNILVECWESLSIEARLSIFILANDLAAFEGLHSSQP